VIDLTVNKVKNNGINILILNAHWYNRGDEAAIRAMIDSLKSNLPIGNMQIMIVHKKPETFPYQDINIIENFPIVNGVFSLLKFGLDALLIAASFGNISLTRSGKEFISLVNDADVVIHAPGGPSIGDLYNENFYLYRLLIPVLKQRLIFFYAPSMGPFSGYIKNIARRFILSKAKKIVVREEISNLYLKDQLSLNAYVSLDSAFQNEIEPNYLEIYDNISYILDLIKSNKVVGITPTDLRWHPSYVANIELRSRIMRSISDITRHLINKDYYVFLIPQLFGLEYNRQEMKLLEDIYQINKDRIIIIPGNIDAYGQQILISKLFCIIGMRYHSNIFATKGTIPSIMIYYEHKMEGFGKKLGRTDLMINVTDISSKNLIEKFEYLEKNHTKIKNELEGRLPLLKADSRKTTEILLQTLGR